MLLSFSLVQFLTNYDVTNRKHLHKNGIKKAKIITIETTPKVSERLMTSYLVVEVVKVASNKNVNVPHYLQHVQALKTDYNCHRSS